jgi:hypothetical protein
MKKIFFSICLLLAAATSCLAQDDWKLKSDKDGIRAYARKAGDSKINSIKIEAEFSSSLSRLVGVIIDVSAYDDWVYNSKNTRLLKQVSPAELYYYAEVKFPWPTTNRDFVSHVTVNQDTHSKTVTINASNVSGWEPVKKNIVRIENSVGKWTITPIGKDRIKVWYELHADPGGDLPVLLINGFSSTGMVATFKNLRHRLERTDITVSTVSFIKD